MKKNILNKNFIMRVAGTLLIVTLLTTTLVSGTFAKSVTVNSGSDIAIVAKNGVKIEVSGSLFADTYKNVQKENKSGKTSETALVVKSNNGDNMISTGEKNKDDGLVITVEGKPETDIYLDFGISNYCSDIWLGNGIYPDMTSGDVYDEKFDVASDVFTLSNAYYPIKYTLTQTNNKETKTLVESGNLANVKNEIKSFEKTYKADTDLAEEIGTLKLTWKWDFNQNNKADILLKNIANDKDDINNLIFSINKNIEKMNVINDKSFENIKHTEPLETVTSTVTETLNAINGAYSINARMDFAITLTAI
jgi:hypothetical protein